MLFLFVVSMRIGMGLFVVSMRIEDRDGRHGYGFGYGRFQRENTAEKMRHLPLRIFKAIGGGKDLLF